MKAIDFPFRFRGGSVQLTTDYRQVVRAQIIDALMTNNRERVMRPDYGCDIQSFVFDGVDDLRLSDTASLIRDRLDVLVPRAFIEMVSVDQSPLSKSTLLISVKYRPSSYDNPDTLTVSVSKDDL